MERISMIQKLIDVLPYAIFCFVWLPSGAVLAGSGNLAAKNIGDAVTNREAGIFLVFTPLPVSDELQIKNESQARFAVSVTTNKLQYQSGEIIIVTLRNRLPDYISAPLQIPTGCSNLGLQKLVDDRWVRQGVCDAKGTNLAIVLDPKSMLTAALVREIRQTKGIEGPHLGRPSLPGVVMGNQTLIPAQSESEELMVIVPEGDLNVRGFLYGTLSVPIPPGSYRLVFNFVPGTTSSTQTVYSEQFVVNG